MIKLFKQLIEDHNSAKFLFLGFVLIWIAGILGALPIAGSIVMSVFATSVISIIVAIICAFAELDS